MEDPTTYDVVIKFEVSAPSPASARQIVDDFMREAIETVVVTDEYGTFDFGAAKVVS